MPVVRGTKGFSIAEVMVVMVILGLLSGVGIMMLRLGASSRRQQDLSLESYTQGRQAVARLRREMRGARVLEPTLEDGVGQALLYSYPLLEDNVLVVDAAGKTKWAGEARVFQEGDSLKLEKPVGAAPQLLARLDGGDFKVQRDASFTTLTVKVGRPERPRERFERSFRVSAK